MAPERSSASPLLKFVGALVTLVLLAPLPLLATLDLSNVTWLPTGSTGTALFTIANGGPSLNPNETDVTFTFANGASSTNGSQTFQSTMLTSASSSDTLSGTWASLTSLKFSNLLAPESFNVTVTVSPPGPSNNMFNKTYTGPATPTAADDALSPVLGGLTSSSIITVKFTYSQVKVSTNGSLPTTTFTLRIQTP